MGYRFKLQHSNYIANLVNGNVLPLLRSIVKNEEDEIIFFEFLEESLRRSTRDSLFSGNPDLFRQIINEYYENVQTFKLQINRVRESDGVKIDYLLREDSYNREELNKDLEKIREFLEKFAQILGEPKIKILLLPGFEENDLNKYMTSIEAMEEAIKIHPNNSGLILQLKELPRTEDLSVLDIFKGFEKALFKVEDWPGIIAWNKKESIFLPVKNREEVKEILNIVRDERYAFKRLKEYKENIDKTKAKSVYSHIVHLSDLHLGGLGLGKNKNELLRILKNDIIKKEETDVIITGDLVDTPSIFHAKLFSDFCNKLKELTAKEPICILGNHDMRILGLIQIPWFNSKLKNQIEILDDKKIIILKFDSNVTGKYAQGKITKEQMDIVEAQLNNLLKDNKYEQFTKIAILHHHVEIIDYPTWLQHEWFEKLLGPKRHEESMKLIDADNFLKWTKAKDVKYILHGHKHIPYINNLNQPIIVGAGSATGNITDIKNKPYIAFNLLTVDIINKKIVSVKQFYQDTIDKKTKHFEIKMI